jgi:hypothetical protein
MAYLYQESVTVLLHAGSEELAAGGLNRHMLGSDDCQNAQAAVPAASSPKRSKVDGSLG